MPHIGLDWEANEVVVGNFLRVGGLGLDWFEAIQCHYKVGTDSLVVCGHWLRSTELW